MHENVFSLGDIVSLNSHPYHLSIETVLISGDPTLLPPLMVIVEILYDYEYAKPLNGNKEDELPATIRTTCKCMWYSSKSGQFEEAWIPSNILKLIQQSEKTVKTDGLLSDGVLNHNLSVALKTVDLELQKSKSSFSCDEAYHDNVYRISITPLLSFVSPIMEVLHLKEADNYSKHLKKLDPRSGNQKHISAQWVLKCKWYNSHLDKMSEKYLPIDVVKIIPHIKESRLKEIADAIAYGQHFRFGVGENQTILRPKCIVNKSGFYFLRSYDFKLNKLVEIRIDDAVFLNCQDPIKVESPTFNFQVNGVHTQSVIEEYLEVIKQANEKNSLLRIRYKNQNEKVIVRTIKHYKPPRPAKDEKGNEIFYLTAFCLNRNAERTYRSDRIQKLQILDLEFQILKEAEALTG